MKISRIEQNPQYDSNHNIHLSGTCYLRRRSLLCAKSWKSEKPQCRWIPPGGHKKSCHAFDRRLKDEGTVSLGRCVAIYSETKTEGSGNKSFRHLHLHLHLRELETELLLAAKRASLAYGSTSSASERSASQNSSDLS